jgi:regulator of cell morphogenesis and NO signaling
LNGTVIQIKIVEMGRIKNNSIELLSNQDMFSAHQFEDWACDLLADHIVRTHHHDEIKSITEIQNLIEQAFGTTEPKPAEIKLIKDLFRQLSNELLLHMKKEELVLFPFIKKLTEAESDLKTVTSPAFGSVKLPISVMKMEHQTSAIMLNKLANLADGYEIPDDANEILKDLYLKLKSFDDDLRRHIDVEDNVLFPKVIEMEKALLVC